MESFADEVDFISQNEKNDKLYVDVIKDKYLTEISKKEFISYLSNIKSIKSVKVSDYFGEFDTDYDVYIGDYRFRFKDNLLIKDYLGKELFYYIGRYDKKLFDILIYSDSKSTPYENGNHINGYDYKGNDPLLKLIYDAEKKYFNDKNENENTFIIPAVHLFDYVIEGNKLRAFINVYCNEYYIKGNYVYYGFNVVDSETQAITFTIKDNNKDNINDISDFVGSSYEIVSGVYGAGFADSVKVFCKKPVSNEIIAGLADKMIVFDNSYLSEITKKNLTETLNDNGYNNMYKTIPYNMDKNKERIN